MKTQPDIADLAEEVARQVRLAMLDEPHEIRSSAERSALRAAIAKDHADQIIALITARLAPANALPGDLGGWKLVPVEPTPEMIRAGATDDTPRTATNSFDRMNETLTLLYSAMLAAAPQPPLSLINRVARAEGGSSLVEDGRFLLDRLADFENVLTADPEAREFYGHVAPAIARFGATLKAARVALQPAEET